MKELILLVHIPSEAVNLGFLPAADRLGLQVVMLTDHPDAHREYFRGDDLPAYPKEIVSCDVFNPLAVVDLIARRATMPSAIFSNSDHLQTSTAIAADYFGLPAKDWNVTYLCKNKAQMRLRQSQLGMDTIKYRVVCDPSELLDCRIPFPCVVKPKEGVASQHVKLVEDFSALQGHCQAIWDALPGRPLLVEDYIEGPLYTLETFSDGKQLSVLGGFRVSVSPPPHFVEMHAEWLSAPPSAYDVVRQIVALGVGFPCLSGSSLFDH